MLLPSFGGGPSLGQRAALFNPDLVLPASQEGVVLPVRGVASQRMESYGEAADVGPLLLRVRRGSARGAPFDSGGNGALHSLAKDGAPPYGSGAPRP